MEVALDIELRVDGTRTTSISEAHLFIPSPWVTLVRHTDSGSPQVGIVGTPHMEPHCSHPLTTLSLGLRLWDVPKQPCRAYVSPLGNGPTHAASPELATATMHHFRHLESQTNLATLLCVPKAE